MDYSEEMYKELVKIREGMGKLREEVAVLKVRVQLGALILLLIIGISKLDVLIKILGN